MVVENCFTNVYINNDTPAQTEKKSKAHSLETIRDKKRKAFTQLFSYSSGVCGRTRLLGFWGGCGNDCYRRSAESGSSPFSSQTHSTAQHERKGKVDGGRIQTSRPDVVIDQLFFSRDRPA